ncbi:EF hand family protein [Cryptosporidium felis]|nr:EF hand family protein [Cryptosporidium felis]
MQPIWIKPDFLDLAIGSTWGIPSEALGCDGGSWFSVSASARFYLGVLEKLQNEYLSPGCGSGIQDLEGLRQVINKIRNSASYISEEFPWSRLKYMYEKAVLRKSPLDYKEFHRFVVDTISKVRGLESGHSIILPGVISLEDLKKPIFLLYMVSRSDGKRDFGELQSGRSTLAMPFSGYSFSVVNVSGFGTEFHAYSTSPIACSPTSLLKDSVLVVSDVYTEHLFHSAFWISLYRLSFVSSNTNIHYLYTVLIPFLNGKSLYDNWRNQEQTSLGNIWVPDPRRRHFGSSSRLVQSALQLLFQSYSVSVFPSLNPEFKASQFRIFLNWSVLRMLEEDFVQCLKSSYQLCFFSASTPIYSFLKAFSAEISEFSYCLSLCSGDSTGGLEIAAPGKKGFSLATPKASIPFKQWYEYLSNFKASFERVFSSTLFGFGMGSSTLSPSLASQPIIKLGLHSAFANFGQFRLDGPNVMLLAGDSNEPNVDIPVELDLIDRKIDSVEDVIIVLETCISACVLLSTQSESTKNSFLLRFKLIQHVFQDLVPIPLPWTHPQKRTRCFWHSSQQGLKRSQQVRILELLSAVSRHFLASSFSLGFNCKIPQFDRLITMAVIACIADNVSRSSPSDFRSPLSIHLTGNHPGPKTWFYIDTLNLQEITDFGVYTDPSSVSIRCMVLDYFHSVRHFVSDETLRLQPAFAFEEKPGSLDEGTIELLMQISTDFGFPAFLTVPKEDQRKQRSYSVPLFFTGEAKEMVDVIPEFYHLRDIFFYLKFVITLTPENHPEIASWSPSSSHLSWSYNPNKDLISVRGFDRFLECSYVPPKSCDNKQQHKGLWHSFTGWLTSSTDKNGLKQFSKLADPNTIINSFDSLGNVQTDFLASPGSSFSSVFYGQSGQNYQTNQNIQGGQFSQVDQAGQTLKSANGVFSGPDHPAPSHASSSTPVSVGDESDILYIRNLPALSEQLQPEEIERILQYLTTPYLRIPLLLQFFSDENRINSLSSISVQHIIWMSILEPWQWSPPPRPQSDRGGEGQLARPSLLVPVEDVKEISTPSGLLFNELLNSPSALFGALEELMLMALDKDTGSFAGSNSRIILFVLRVSVVISNYAKYLIGYHESWSSADSGDAGLVPFGDLQVSGSSRIAGPPPVGVSRGFEAILKDPEKANTLRIYLKRLRYVIEHLYLKMILEWMSKALRDLEVPALCVLYAHIAYILGQPALSLEDVDFRFVTLLLSSLVFLNTHYSIEFGSRNTRKTSSSLFISSPWSYTTNNLLGVPDLDLFTIQARTRSIIVRWLSTHVLEANLVLDTVVNAVAMRGIGFVDLDSRPTKDLGPSTREWIQLPGLSGSGRFVPLSEIPPDLYEWLSCEDLKSLKGRGVLGIGSRHLPGSSSYKSLSWWRLKRRFSRILHSGSLKPGGPGGSADGEGGATPDDPGLLSQFRYLSSRLEYNEWFRTVLSINTETEINVQFSLFSLKNNNLRVLGSWIQDFPDFQDVIRESEDFSSESRSMNQFQSADIASTQNLYWCKLIGSRIDLYRWEPFHKTVQITFKTRYSRHNLPKGTEWIVELFEPWRAIYLNGVSTIYMENPEDRQENLQGTSDSFLGFSRGDPRGGSRGLAGGVCRPPDFSNMVRMQFLFPLYEPGEGPESPNPKAGSSTLSAPDFSQDGIPQQAEIVTHSLKEIVIHRFPPVILVFDIVEQGRLYYKQLCHTSNVSYSLGSPSSRFIAPLLSVGSPGGPQAEHSGSTLRQGSGTDPSLGGRFTLASGLPLTRGRKPSQSLVIMRDYHKEPVGTEMYVPPRFLLGQVPQILLETHEFWQSQSSGNIRGYPRRSLRAHMDEDFRRISSPSILGSGNGPHSSLPKEREPPKTHDEDLYLVDIFVIPSSDPIDKYGSIGDGMSLIQRRYIHDPNRTQTLINVQTLYGVCTEIQHIFETLQRLEDVSHTLLWSNIGVEGLRSGGAWKEDLSRELTLDQIEFPRLHLSFTRRERDRSNTLLTMPTNFGSGFCPGQVRYVCDQHSGLYLSWRSLLDYPLTKELLRGLPHSVLLENDDGDFFILVPATAKPVLIPPIAFGSPSALISPPNLRGLEERERGDREREEKGRRVESGGQSTRENGLFERFSASLSLVSGKDLLTESLESISTTPGQYLVSMASEASQTLLNSALTAVNTTTRSMVDGAIRKTNEIMGGGSKVFLDGSNAELGTRPGDSGVAPSSLLYKGTYVLDRGDQVWISRLGPTKHYLYPIHTSKSFVFITSVVSGLYLMLWRFLEQQFESVLSVLDIATSSDMDNSGSMEDEWSSEERQLWEVFNKLGHLWDSHPDAHACRLKIWLYCLRHISMPCGIRPNLTRSNTGSFCTWDLSSDIEGYVSKIGNVSANCRLTVEEELEVLQAFPHFVKDNPDLNNRLSLVSSAFERIRSFSKLGSQEGPLSRSNFERIEFQQFLPQVPQVDDFDSWMDISCLELGGGSESLTTTFGGGKRDAVGFAAEEKRSGNLISSLWESLTNTVGTLSLPPVPYVSEDQRRSLGSDYGIERFRTRPEGRMGSGSERMLVSGEDATEFIAKFLARSSLSKMISNAFSATVSGISAGPGPSIGGGIATTTGSILEGPLVRDFSDQFSSSSGALIFLSDWIFIYELLTGNFPLEVVPGETTHIWGVLFARSLPAWDWKSPSILVSILRLLILNPGLALSSRMPRFSEEEARQSKLQFGGSVLRSQEGFQNLIKEASQVLNQEFRNGNLVTHSKRHSAPSFVSGSSGKDLQSSGSVSSFFSSLLSGFSGNSHTPGSSRAWAISPESRISRWSISLGRGNYNCEVRRLGCIKVSECQISKQDLLCYSRSPIHAVSNIKTFLVPVSGESRKQGTQSPIYDLPSKLLAHPISQTSIGKSSLERLRSDIREYSDLVSRRSDFSILGLDFQTLLQAFLSYNGLQSEGVAADGKEGTIPPLSSKAPKWEEIRQGIMDLRVQLLQLYYRDGRFVDFSVERLDEVANSRSGAVRARLEEGGGGESLLFWFSSFGRLFGKEPVLHFDFLVSQLMSLSSGSEIKRLSLFVEDEDVEVIHSLTAAAMMTVNRRTQISTALIQLRDVICFFSEIQDEFRLRGMNSRLGQTDQNSSWLKRSLVSLEMKLKNVARVLSSQRHYMVLKERRTGRRLEAETDLAAMSAEDLVAEYDPRFLVFEFAYSILLRSDQVQLIHKLYDAAVSGRSVCHQMIMGAGKTTVISPLLSLLLGDSRRLVVQVVPQALLEFTRDVLRSRFSCIVKKRILRFQFNRNSICTSELYRRLVHAKEQKAIVLCHPTSIKSLFLKTVFLFRVLRFWNSEGSSFSASGFKMALRYLSIATGINQNKLSGLFDWKKGRPFGKQTLGQADLGNSKGSKEVISRKIPSRQSRKAAMDAMSGALNKALSGEDKEELYLQYKKELDLCLRILHIFKHEAVVIVDEIDTILHPLKSELHWPIGEKIPLDLSSEDSSASLENRPFYDGRDGLTAGLRWLVPWYLIEALLTKPDQVRQLSNEQMLRSGSVVGLLLKIQSKLEAGVASRRVQCNPHLVILDEDFYRRELRPLLIRWIVLAIRLHRFSGLSDELCEAYFDFGEEPCSGAKRARLDELDDTSMKLLNLSRDWVNEYLPHIFRLVHRVSYGLLDEEGSGVKRRDWLGRRGAEEPSSPQGILGGEQTPPLSRHLLSIPFVGKDTPSVASEYDGLRRSDLYHLLDLQKRSCESGFGQLKDRQSVLEFNKWVRLAGGRVRGTKRDQIKKAISQISSLSTKETALEGLDLIGSDTENLAQRQGSRDKREIGGIGGGRPESGIDRLSLLWPLDVINLEDGEQLEQLYLLLRRQPLVIRAFLGRLVFPELLEYSERQLSASGQEIGGEILFSTRLGFSGTPSELLPVELGRCEFEKGSDGEMIHYLTNGSIVSSIEILDVDWTVRDFLMGICRSRDKEVHALIDSGAFVTGLSNVQVAEFLLRNGLKDIDAVVFIDERDKQMIMLRDGFRVIEISQCGVSLERRFAFYDHVHSIGQDVKHTPLAKAILTVSKDMVFRDFAQGAYRMRQLGQGQTIHIVLQAQVADMIEKNGLTCEMISERSLFSKKDESPRGDGGGRSEAKGGNLVSLGEEGDFKIPDALLFLRCLCGWLLIQSITREFEQSQLLCVQSLENIWRKKAFSRMVSEHVHWEDGSFDQREDLLVDVFVERLSFEIPSSVPLGVSLRERLKSRLADYRELVEDFGTGRAPGSALEAKRGGEAGIALAETLLGQLEEMSHYRGVETEKQLGFDREMEKELEMELEMDMEVYQEREQQQEKEQEKEQEKQQETENANSGVKWSKPSLDVSRDLWPFESLLVGANMLGLGGGGGGEDQGAALDLEERAVGERADKRGKKLIKDFAAFSIFSTSKKGGIHREDPRACPNLQNIFLPLTDYTATSFCGDGGCVSLSFPSHLRFTRNLYNPAIARSSSSPNVQQRLNNLSIILEWEFQSRGEDSLASNNLPKDHLLQLKEAFAIFDGNFTGKINLDDLPDLLKTLNWVENTNFFEKEILKQLRIQLQIQSPRAPSKKASQPEIPKEVIRTVDNLIIPGGSLSQANDVTKGENDLVLAEGDDFFGVGDHPWENSSSLAGNGNNKFVEAESGEQLILESSCLQEKMTNSISFEELYNALNRVLNTSSNKCYIGVSLEEAQSIRWFMHQVSSPSSNEVGERLRKILPVETTGDFLRIRIYHLSNTLLLLDEINDKTLSLKLSQIEEANSPCVVYNSVDSRSRLALNNYPSSNFPLDSSSPGSRRTNTEIGKINILELQAQAIFKFVNSETNFSRQEISTAVRTLQNCGCKQRKEFYVAIRRCRRRNRNNGIETDSENSILKNGFNNNTSNLSILFSTPNESAILQCRALASRLASKLEKSNITILDLFKALDKDQTGNISIVCLYAYLEYLEIAPNPVDYLKIILFISNNSSESMNGSQILMHNSSISQENFIRVFSSQNNMYLNNGNQSTLFGSNSPLRKAGKQGFVPRIEESWIIQAERKLEQKLKEFYNNEYLLYPSVSGGNNYNNDAPGGIQLFDSNFLSKLKCKLTLHSNFQKIFEIPGIISILSPEQLEGRYRGVMKKNRERICLGQYGSESIIPLRNQSPNSSVVSLTGGNHQLNIIEITDNSCSGMSESSELKRFVNIVFPFAKKFKPIFRGSLCIPNSEKETGIFSIWRPIPPSNQFVSLGVIITKGDSTPASNCVRCIPVQWCRLVNYKSLPLLGSLTKNDKSFNLSSIEISKSHSQIHPVSFCITSSLQILGAIVNSKSPNSREGCRVSGSFVDKEQFQIIHDKLHIPADKKIEDYLNYNQIADRNLLFSKLFWLDIPFSEISFSYSNNEGVETKPQTVNGSHLVPRISNRRSQSNSGGGSGNPISIFGI